MLPGIILILTLASLPGCGTCVKVEATYEEAWQATRGAFRAQPELISAHPVERYDEGSIDVKVTRTRQRDELHYHAEIKPVGGDERLKREVCVWVQQVDAPAPSPGGAGDQDGQMQARRRRDLETAIAGHVERVLGVPDEQE